MSNEKQPTNFNCVKPEIEEIEKNIAKAKKGNKDHVLVGKLMFPVQIYFRDKGYDIDKTAKDKYIISWKI